MLTLILAESSIELIPKVIVNDPSIISDAKKRRKKPEQLIIKQLIDYLIPRSEDVQI
jgi:rRNA small subunit pseudouridine methyltransferase Nep1